LAWKSFFAANTKHLISVCERQVSREKAFASEEEKKVQVINADVAKKQKACQEDLAKAEPALIAAKNALGTLNKVRNIVYGEFL